LRTWFTKVLSQLYMSVTSQNPNFGIHKSLSKVFELKFGTGIQLETRKQMHKGFIRLVNIS
jgi:hypothetical protein